MLLMVTDKIGYGNWAEIKRQIRREPKYMFDHLFMSRSEEEIKKRVIYLVQLIEKEGMAPEPAKMKPSIDQLANEIQSIVEISQRELEKTLSKMNLA